MTSEGLVERQSGNSVAETLRRLQDTLHARGITLFAVVDHSGEARKLGMEMPETKLLIFGNPRAGTPLMLASPGVAIDLPLKILVREDGAGKVWIAYNAPEYLARRHGLPQQLLANISVVESLVNEAAEKKAA
jgi:uncharacterized protein (DUF302 family)